MNRRHGSKAKGDLHWRDVYLFASASAYSDGPVRDQAWQKWLLRIEPADGSKFHVNPDGSPLHDQSLWRIRMRQSGAVLEGAYLEPIARKRGKEIGRQMLAARASARRGEVRSPQGEVADSVA